MSASPSSSLRYPRTLPAQFAALQHALQLSWAPRTPPARSTQADALRSFLRQSVGAGKGGSVYVSGAPGTGKTLTVDRVLADMFGTRMLDSLADDGSATGVESSPRSGSGSGSGSASKGRSRARLMDRFGAAEGTPAEASSTTAAAAPRVLYVNAMSVSQQPRSLYPRLLSLLRRDASLAPTPPMDALEALKREWVPPEGASSTQSLSAGQMSVVVVDEVDALLSGSSAAVLYSLLEWPLARGSRLVLVAISNSISMLETRLPHLAARGAMPHSIVFPTYGASELRDIALQRLNSIYPLQKEESTPASAPASLDTTTTAITAVPSFPPSSPRASPEVPSSPVASVAPAPASGRGRKRKVSGPAEPCRTLSPPPSPAVAPAPATPSGRVSRSAARAVAAAAIDRSPSPPPSSPSPATRASPSPPASGRSSRSRSSTAALLSPSSSASIADLAPATPSSRKRKAEASATATTALPAPPARSTISPISEEPEHAETAQEMSLEEEDEANLRTPQRKKAKQAPSSVHSAHTDEEAKEGSDSLHPPSTRATPFIPDECLDLLCMRVAKGSGDVRRLLDLLRAVLDELRREWMESEQTARTSVHKSDPSSPNAASSPSDAALSDERSDGALTPPPLPGAYPPVQASLPLVSRVASRALGSGGDQSARLSSLPAQQKVCLLIACLLSTLQGDKNVVVDYATHYARFVREFHLPPLRGHELADLLSSLEGQGLLRTRASRTHVRSMGGSGSGAGSGRGRGSGRGVGDTGTGVWSQLECTVSTATVELAFEDDPAVARLLQRGKAFAKALLSAQASANHASAPS